MQINSLNELLKNAIFCDFEFNRVVHPMVHLVSCVTYDYGKGEVKKWWLHKNKPIQAKLKEYLLQNRFKAIVSYAAIAEARSFMSLGIEDVLLFKWIDLFIEYRCLTNNNDDLQWGNQLVDGKVKYVKKPKPKWERTEEDKQYGFSATHSLAEATYKLLGLIRDTDHKTVMRDLIISDPDEFTVDERLAIIGYNKDDVILLPKILKRVFEEYEKLLNKNLHKFQPSPYDEEELIEEMFLRGRYAAITAEMENKGYPIDVQKTKNFSSSIPAIFYEVNKEINELFPNVKPFRWNRKAGRFSENKKNIKKWVMDNHDIKRWMKTDKKDISLALDAFQKFYDFKHDYPKDNFGAQMVRWAKLKQTMNGFSASKGKKNFWDSVGPDGRVRPYTNIYRAQSSRSQPAATGFMFLKPAWTRSLVMPAPNMFMAGNDYSSEEFFISALVSRDARMIDAYLSGDPYFAFAKDSGQVPKDAIRKDHEEIRDFCKGTVLGISYLMSKYGLAIDLTNKSKTGRVWTEDEAQEQIDLFNESYQDFFEHRENIIDDYGDSNPSYIKLPCGWYMWGDNENFRSVANVPIQGHGASIMRLAVYLARKDGIYCPITLHDALYMEDKVGNESKIIKLEDVMREAFVHYAPKDMRKIAEGIRIDKFAWSSNYEKDSTMLVNGHKIPVSNEYIDKRGIEEYKKFSVYFHDNLGELLWK